MSPSKARISIKQVVATSEEAHKTQKQENGVWRTDNQVKFSPTQKIWHNVLFHTECPKIISDLEILI